MTSPSEEPATQKGEAENSWGPLSGPEWRVEKKEKAEETPSEARVPGLREKLVSKAVVEVQAPSEAQALVEVEPMVVEEMPLEWEGDEAVADAQSPVGGTPW